MIEVPINPDLSENVDYNNPDFPVYIKRGLLSTYQNHRAACHWHTDFEFIYVYGGSMDYSVNDARIRLSKGQGLFVNSNCLHYGYSDTCSECDFLCVLLHPSLLTSNNYFATSILTPLTDNHCLPYILLRPAITWQNDIILELLHIEQSLNEKNEALNIIQGFTNILKHIVCNVTSADQNPHDANLSILTAMIGHVQQNYDEKITMASLANAGGCCKTKCNELFRRYLNMTPLSYLTKYRLEKSTELLARTSYSIAEIAYSCGFSGASYYCETFGKNYGLTPKQYRNKNSPLFQ